MAITMITYYEYVFAIKYIMWVYVSGTTTKVCTNSTNVHTHNAFVATFNAVDVEYVFALYVCAEQMIMWSECKTIFLLIRCYIALSL